MIQSSRERSLQLRIDADSNEDLASLLKLVTRSAYKFLREDPESEAELFKGEPFCSGSYDLKIKQGETLIEEPGDIDRKFEITARSRHSNKVYTHAHGIFFKVEDAALLPMLRAYILALQDKGAGESQIIAADLLAKRVKLAQDKYGVKIPDVDPTAESYLLTDEEGNVPDEFAHLANHNTRDRQALLDIQSVLGRMGNESQLEAIGQIIEDTLKEEVNHG